MSVSRARLNCKPYRDDEELYRTEWGKERWKS